MMLYVTSHYVFLCYASSLLYSLLIYLIYKCPLYLLYWLLIFTICYTSVDTEMCCPKGKCGCQYFTHTNISTIQPVQKKCWLKKIDRTTMEKSNLVDVRIPKKFSVCIFIQLNWKKISFSDKNTTSCIIQLLLILKMK
jgi:hypothetical protein